MATKNHRDGKKFGGNHTTIIDGAIPIVDLVSGYNEVNTISPGFIKAGLTSANGKYRLKIGECSGGVILSIRGNTSQQEIRFYSTDIQVSKSKLIKDAHALGYGISIGLTNQK